MRLRNIRASAWLSDHVNVRVSKGEKLIDIYRSWKYGRCGNMGRWVNVNEIYCKSRLNKISER